MQDNHLKEGKVKGTFVTSRFIIGLIETPTGTPPGTSADNYLSDATKSRLLTAVKSLEGRKRSEIHLELIKDHSSYKYTQAQTQLSHVKTMTVQEQLATMGHKIFQVLTVANGTPGDGGVIRCMFTHLDSRDIPVSAFEAAGNSNFESWLQS